MLNIIKFLFRYYIFLLFIALQIFSFLLTYQFSSYHKTFITSRANSISSSANSINQNIITYIFLSQVNDSLAIQNARLMELLSLHKMKNDSTVKHVSDSINSVSYSYIFANVVRNSVSGSNNVIYLNKGRKDGIKPQMGVIHGDGIVGQVVDVTENYSAVMSVLNKKFRTSAKLYKSGYFGNLVWDGFNPEYASLEEIPKHVQMNNGDSIVTNGFSELFPPDILIGKVHSTKIKAENNFTEVDVKLSVDFRKLSYAYIVINKNSNELSILDSLSNKFSQ